MFTEVVDNEIVLVPSFQPANVNPVRVGAVGSVMLAL